MTDEVRMAFNGNQYLILMIIALVTGVLICRNYRKNFFIPALLISAMILNPLTYSLWYKYNEYGYWRLLWILPVIPASAFVPAYLIEKIGSRVVRLCIISAFAVIFILCGCFVYHHQNTAFAKATNPDKLPQDVVCVGEALLEIDEEPRVVTDTSISQYLRQYSGKIKSLYARDVVFEGANSPQAAETYANLTAIDGDMEVVAYNMQIYGYRYLITKNTDENRKKRIEAAGFRQIRQINEYGIYQIGY